METRMSRRTAVHRSTPKNKRNTSSRRAEAAQHADAPVQHGHGQHQVVAATPPSAAGYKTEFAHVCADCFARLGRGVKLLDDPEFEYRPAVFVRRQGSGADLGFRYGSHEGCVVINRSDLVAFHDLLHDVLGQLFAPGTDARVDEMLGRKASHLEDARDQFELAVRDGELSLSLTIERDDKGKMWETRLALTTAVGRIGIELFAYELLGLHDAVCGTLRDIEDEPQAESVQADEVSVA